MVSEKRKVLNLGDKTGIRTFEVSISKVAESKY